MNENNFNEENQNQDPMNMADVNLNQQDVNLNQQDVNSENNATEVVDNINVTATEVPYVTYPNNQASQQSSSNQPYAPATYSYVQGAGTTNTASTVKKKPSKAGKVTKFVACAVAFGLIAGGVMTGVNIGTGHFASTKKIASVATTVESTGDTVKTSAGTTSTDVSKMVSNTMPSIVAVNSTFVTSNGSNSFFNRYYGNGQSQESSGSGSGIIISKSDKELLVVTNNHVISDSNYGDAKKISLTLCDDEVVTATIKGTDADADLAVLSVNLSDIKSSSLGKIKIAVLGNSDSLAVGQSVVAIGNALGYGQSVTTGVVSALNREVQMTDKTMTLLQTDAAINPGNSGGALLNTNGEVIGINSVKYSSSEVEGMGYAIPMAIAKPIINDLMNEVVVPEGEQAYLGITGADVSNELTSVYNLPEGVFVSSVIEGSPAEKAEIHQSDIITKVGDRKISTMAELQNLIAKKKAGDEIKVTYKRQASNGEYKETTVTVKLTKKPDSLKSDSNNNNSNGNNDNSNDNSNGNSGRSNNGDSSQDDMQDFWNYFN